MEIDWFTVIAQIVNFLILIWLLKKFLYKPVLNAVDERERNITSQLEDAARHKAEARKEKERFRQKNEQFDREHADQMREAREQAEEELKRLNEEARLESSALRERLEESLRQQVEELRETVKTRTKKEVFAIARQALEQLADASLEEQMVRVFILKVNSLEGPERQKFKKSLTGSTGPVVVWSVFEPAPALKKELEEALSKVTGKALSVEYRTDPDLVSGLMVESSDYQLAWSIETYLNSLKLESIIP